MLTKLKRRSMILGWLTAALGLGACGGGGSSSSSPAVPALNPPTAPLVQVSGASPYGVNCGGAMSNSVSYENAAVEPYEAVNPANPANIIGVWQQDRWSDGGAHGLVAAYSMDGGKTWHPQTLTLSVCAGGDSGNNADYARASDPWVSFSPDGTAYVISISFSGNTLAPDSLSAVLVTRSADGGATWSNPVPLIVDASTSTSAAFNDKESITADPNDSNYVYAVWDRLDSTNHGPTMFARSTDGGMTWQAAVPIWDPGVDNQTIGNEIVGLADGTILDLFEEIDGSTATASSLIRVISSADHGATWSSPVTVAANDSVGTFDPNTRTLIRAGSGLPQMTAGPGDSLVVVWQDGRFSGGQRDDIALSRSSDGGLTWSAPVEVNSVGSVPAFTPSVAVMADGTLGVTYFDFRNDPPGNSGSLPTDYWFTSSRDGVHWSEQHITGSFDLDLAPQAEGLFLGDYQALNVVGDAFVPFYVQTADQGTGNRTNSYVLPPQPVPLHVTRQVSHLALAATAPAPDALFRQRIHENLMQLLRSENPGWDQIRANRRRQQPTPP